MDKLSFYDQIGVVVPGAVLLFGLLFFVPELKTFFAAGDGISVGGLGIFVLIAYAAGQAVAALGNLIELLYWKAAGGVPSDWVVGPTPRLLSSAQIKKLEEKVQARFGLSLPPLSGVQRKDWFPVFRQIYSDVEKNGKPQRADTFNGIYGLTRGLCAALLAFAIAIVALSPGHWHEALGALALAAVFLFRMQRFGRHYARELYIQFLILP